jgi:hypothetical protein
VDSELLLTADLRFWFALLLLLLEDHQLPMLAIILQPD